MPEIAKFVEVNSVGTGGLLETIRDENLPVKKVGVASSRAVYSEGAALCLAHGRVFPPVRPVAQLAGGDFTVHGPLRGRTTAPTPTPEEAPIGGEMVYAITKVDQEMIRIPRAATGIVPALRARLKDADAAQHRLSRRSRQFRRRSNHQRAAAADCAYLPVGAMPVAAARYAVAAVTPSRSTPVSMPMPCSMYSRSSVARLPEAPGA